MKDDESSEPKSNHSDKEAKRTMAIHAVQSFLLALLIVVGAIVLFIVLVATKDDPKKKERKELTAAVRVQPVVFGNHEVEIETQGVVRSMREVQLAAEVGGRVTFKSSKLLEGGLVKEGEELIRIDAADYKAAEARARSAVADAQLALAQEKAMAEQAELDWKKLGRGEPSELVLRQPQLIAANARLESTKAELLRAGRDVKRASIVAPFDARVRGASVEIGAVLAPGTPVAELYSTDELEVRLPFTLLDYGFLSEEEGVKLELSAKVGGEIKTWPAVLDRVDGEVQRSTLSAYGMAKVKANADGELPPVGLFVEAKVPGKELDGVVVLPRSAVRGSNEVWVTQKGELAKREISILRTSRHELVVRGNFKAGDQLVLTRLSAPVDGMIVEAVQKGAEDTPNP